MLFDKIIAKRDIDVNNKKSCKHTGVCIQDICKQSISLSKKNGGNTLLSINIVINDRLTMLTKYTCTRTLFWW